MGFGFLVVAGGLAAGCYYGYRKLQRVEQEIREELRAKGLAAEDEPAPAPSKPAVTPPRPAPPSPSPAPGGSLEAQVVACLETSPGMLQTELYARFPESERKALQAVLLKMDKAGTLRRTKEKSTYRLDLP